MRISERKTSSPLLSIATLQFHWGELNAVYFQSQLPAIEIQWSSRLTSSAGMFVNAHRPGPHRVSQTEGCGAMRLIRLSTPLLKGKPIAEIRRTLAHEMIHQWQYDVQKRRPSHGAEFRRFMVRMNEDGMGIAVYHSLSKEVEALVKYAWQCTKCGQAYQRQRRTISPRRHRCGYCQGSLQEVQTGIIKPRSHSHLSKQATGSPFLKGPRQKPQQLVLDFMRCR